MLALLPRRVALPLLPVALVISGAATAAPADQGASFDKRVEATKAAMMGDPKTALRMAASVLSMARELPPGRDRQVSIATAEWLQGEAHIFLNDIGEAAPLIADASAIADRYAPNSKLKGDLLRSQGAIAATNGHVQVALMAFQHAYHVFAAAHEARSQAVALLDIGQVHEDAGDYPHALSYYAQAADTYRLDHNLLVVNYNNRAEVLRKLNRSGDAEELYRAALREARLVGSAVLEVRVLCNLADVQAQRGEIAAATASVQRASRLTQSGEAAAWQPFVLGTMAKIAVADHQFAQAAVLFDRMFQGVDLANTDISFRDFHQAASIAYEKANRSEDALAQLRAYDRLNNGARDLAVSTGAQLASARFDFAAQNLKISNLKASQLQQEVQLEHQRARMRTIVITFVLLIALAVFGFLSFALVTGRRSRRNLQQVNADLERALKAKTEFLATTSHEIRTPLNGILGMTQVMLSDPSVVGEARERIGLVHGAGETMKALVDDILDVAKMESGTVVLVDEPVDVAAMVEEVAGLWREQAAARQVSLISESTGLPKHILADGGRLRQILFNLLSNAVKFTGEGEVTITARVDASAQGEQLSIAVSDTGIGIDRDQQGAIFEPFHQADAGTTRRFGGTGLGLAICRNLARTMRGDITLDSEAGRGSTFTFAMPLVRCAAAGRIEVAERRPRASRLDDARLLLLDANLLAQGMLRGLLEGSVATIDLVASAASAHDAIATGDLDHLLVDARSVLGEDGHDRDALRDLIAVARAHDMYVTVLLPATGPIDASQAVAMGAHDVVIKPVSGAALIAALVRTYDEEVAVLTAAA